MEMTKSKLNTSSFINLSFTSYLKCFVSFRNQGGEANDDQGEDVEMKPEQNDDNDGADGQEDNNEKVEEAEDGADETQEQEEAAKPAPVQKATRGIFYY